MNSTKLTIKDSALSFLVGFLLYQIGTVAFTCIAMIISKFFNVSVSNFLSFLDDAVGCLLLSFTMYGIMLGVFFFFNRKKENKISQKVSLKKLLFYVLVAITSFLMLYPIVTCIDTLIVKWGLKINTLSYSLSTKNYLVSIISITILPAVCEELMFRGLIFKGLQKHGKIFSITVSALMFCIFHMAISQTVYPILMGLLLGVIMYYENNIYYCIAAHFTNNFLSLTLSYFKINLIFNHWTYILLAIILFVLFLVCIVYFLIRNNKTSEKQPIEKTNKLYLSVSLVVMSLFWILVNFI